MFEKSNKWLEIAEKNRTLVILWGIFVACFWYALGQHEGFNQKVEELRETATNIQNLQKELLDSREMVRLWYECPDGAVARLEADSKRLTKERLAPRNIRTTTKEAADELIAERRDFSIFIGKANNFYFSLSSLQELRSKLLEDINVADQITQRGIVFLQTQLTDMAKARKMVPSILGDVDEQRGVIEGQLRDSLIEQIDDRVRTEFNERVRMYNERHRMLDLDIWKTTLAFAYMGACLGGSIGWLFWRRRMSAREKVGKSLKGASE